MRASVIKTFLKQTGLPSEFEPIANSIFDDLLLLLAHAHDRQETEHADCGFTFTQELNLMDEMWHAFILHTRFYTEYCLENFGMIIHHLPETQTENSDSEDEKKKIVDLIETQIQDLSKRYGKNYVNRIYFVYPQIISMGNVRNA
jgi:hypothetical protein